MRCARTTSARPAQGGYAADASLDPERANSALAQLSGRQRAVIYRSHRLGWTTSQIAVELGIADHLVKQELHEALHTLRSRLRGVDERSGT